MSGETVEQLRERLAAEHYRQMKDVITDTLAYLEFDSVKAGRYLEARLRSLNANRKPPRSGS